RELGPDTDRVDVVDDGDAVNDAAQRDVVTSRTAANVGQGVLEGRFVADDRGGADSGGLAVVGRQVDVVERCEVAAGRTGNGHLELVGRHVVEARERGINGGGHVAEIEHFGVVEAGADVV